MPKEHQLLTLQPDLIPNLLVSAVGLLGYFNYLRLVLFILLWKLLDIPSIVGACMISGGIGIFVEEMDCGLVESQEGRSIVRLFPWMKHFSCFFCSIYLSKL